MTGRLVGPALAATLIFGYAPAISAQVVEILPEVGAVDRAALRLLVVAGAKCGGCLCGVVRFEVAGELTQIELCHCAKCKKAYGAAFAATLYARREEFRWLAGEDRVASYDAPPEESPPAYRHSFCATCGGPLPVLWDGFPLVEIPASLLDDVAGSRPAYHMFVTQKAPWHDIADDLPQHSEGGPSEEKVLRSLLSRRRAR